MSFQPLCRYLPVISCQVKKIFVPKIGKQIRNICTHSSKYQHISPILLKKLKHAKKPVRFNPKKKDDFKKIVEIWKNITVQELANVIEKDLDHVYELMLFVKDATIYDHDNAKIDDVEVSAEIVKKSGMKCRIISSPIKSLDLKPSKDISRRPLPDASQLVKRPAVVTIMGHVDHGKTTLLDCLRKSSIVDGEFGGITQHIGAFSVKVSETDMITFLDTPGHAAFSTMRARGANVTDIVVLVVAADDGVMEQTVESIRFANEAGVPIIVAINKIDKPLIDLEHCKKSLLANGIQLEDCGGDVQYVEISALKDMGIDSLIDAILTQAELMGLKSDPKGFVEGVIIESKVDPVRGKLATVLVQRGTLRKGSILVAGTAWSKVRAMFQDDDKSIITGPPSSPVEVIGWRELPFSGDEVLEVASEKEAKNVVEWRKQNEKSEKMRQEASVIQQKINEHLKTYREQLEQKRAQGIRRTRRTNMDKIITSGNDDGPVLSVIIKGDVNGSVEAILDVLDTYYAHNKCRLDVVHHSTGVVNENDVILAESFDAIIYAFNVGIGNNIQKRSKDKKIQIKKYNVIYKMIDDVIEEINSKLPDLDQEEIIGEATVLQNFMVSEGRKKVPVAGSSCTKGTLKKNAFFRIYRNQEEIFNGKLFSMKHLKNEVSSIKSGVECGLMFEDHSLFFEHGDWIKCYEIVQVPQKISWDPGF